MSQVLKRTVKTVLAPAAALAILATGAIAQQPPAAAAAPQCTAKATPAEIPASQTAVRVTLELSAGIGDVSAIEAPEGSGVALAEASDIPREGLANPAEQPQPIQLAAESNTVTLWIKTGQAGEFSLKLQGANGTCDAAVTVK
jgi:hypothetical protein